jgi:hypothetical protein
VIIISERSVRAYFRFLLVALHLSHSQAPHSAGQDALLKASFFFRKKQEKGKTHKNKVFPHSILLSAPARIVSKQTHTHTHKREEERNTEKGEKRGGDDDDDENNAKICLD